MTKLAAKRPRSRDWREEDPGPLARVDAAYVIEVRVFERRGIRVISEISSRGPFGEVPTWHVSVSEQPGSRTPSRNTMRLVRKEFDMEGAEEKDFGIVGLRARHIYLTVTSEKPS